MVVMQLLFDSLSRCFGLPLHPDDNHDHKRNRHRNQSSRNTKPPLGSQPLGVSKSRTRSNEHLKDLSHDEQLEHHHNNDNSNFNSDTGSTRNRRKESNNSLKLHDAEWDRLFDTVSHHQQSSACCFSPTANPIHEHDVTEFPLLEPSPGRTGSFCNVSLSRPKRHTSRNSSTSSSKDVLLRKARKEINKRKLDIFRSDPSSRHQYQQPYKRSATSNSSSFASRLLLGGSSTESPGALLCFANPIFDDDDDDMRLYREGNDRDGEDTITSTLFFESQYEHVVENGPPVPLYYDQALTLDEEHDDEIVKLYENGCIKHEIKSIFCRTNNSQRNDNDENNVAGTSPPPPPPQEQLKPGPKSMADSTSSNEDLDEYLLQKVVRQNCGILDNNHKPLLSDLTSTPHHHHDHQQQHHKIQLYKSDDGFLSTQPTNTMSTIPSPPSVSKSRQGLNVISDLVFDQSVGTGIGVGATSIRRCSRSGGNGGSTSPTSPPMLKLMNYSSLSSGTQALTPVNSASTGHFSPKKEDCTYVDPFDGEGNMEAMVEKI